MLGDEKDSTVTVGTKREDACPNCGCQLVGILTIDGTNEKWQFLGIKEMIKIPVYLSCVGLSTGTIIRYRLDGDSTMDY